SAPTAVDHVDLTIPTGELLAIVGPSGSGKSTLGALVAGLDRPTAGSVVVDETRLDQLDEDTLARWRASNVGIVFQNFHLIPTLTAAENVAMALRFGPRSRDRKQRVADALASVGLSTKAKRLPSQLSGGEQQRVGIARAIVHRPRLIVADEPTGSLDTAAGRVVFDLISGLRDRGTTIVFITHDPALAERADRTVSMVDGRIDSIIGCAR
ncbi:MAG: ABC transporter ATP-binding protein, partial [Acidimicrobiales bacterium]